MHGELPWKRKYEGPVRSLKGLFRGGFEFIWLGQSGFIFSTGKSYILTDAYLSNYLEFNHEPLCYAHDRMMTPPVDDAALPEIDYVLISHRHEDHLDPGLIRKLVTINPEVIYLVPPGCRPALLDYGVNKVRIREINYNKENKIEDNFSIMGIPSAHPKPKFDVGKVWALSYHLKFGDISVFFAGDTTVYPELIDWLKSKTFNLLILPVNGRDPEMVKNGITGNMSFEEGLVLSQMLDTPMMGTHFGMFAFNTIEPVEVTKKIHNFRLEKNVTLTENSIVYQIKREVRQ